MYAQKCANEPMAIRNAILSRTEICGNLDWAQSCKLSLRGRKPVAIYYGIGLPPVAIPACAALLGAGQDGPGIGVRGDG
jgi:hypothetical protein